jgi:regulator of protease activity HflC (stomatin/prohibitin superfamily)
MIINAIYGKKGQQVSKNSSLVNLPGKMTSPEKITQDKPEWKKIIRRLVMAVTQLIVIDILVGVIWLIPTWPRWVAIFLAIGGFSYFLSKKYGERRGMYSGLGHVSIFFLGWLLGGWIGIFFLSLPLMAVYYFVLYQFAMAIIPANDPDCNLVLFDKNNEKWQRFIILVNYTWGIQYPVVVVADDWGRELSPRIPGSPFRTYGSPGVILTRAHQVAGITNGIEFSRIEGPGVIFTRRFERPLEIVDMRRQVRSCWIEAFTKDGIPFKAKILTAFQVNNSSPDQKSDGFSFSRKWVRRLLRLLGVIQSTPGDNAVIFWDEKVVEQFQQIAQQTLAQRTLNELWQPQDRAKYESTVLEIGDAIKAALQTRLDEQGISVDFARMVDFTFSEEIISDQQLATWQSSWARQANQTLADGEAEAERLQEEARAYAQSVLLRALAEGMKQTTPEMSRYVIAIRFVSAIQELMKSEPEVAEKLGPEVDSRLEHLKQRIGQQ